MKTGKGDFSVSFYPMFLLKRNIGFESLLCELKSNIFLPGCFFSPVTIIIGFAVQLRVISKWLPWAIVKHFLY